MGGAGGKVERRGVRGIVPRASFFGRGEAARVVIVSAGCGLALFLDIEQHDYLALFGR